MAKKPQESDSTIQWKLELRKIKDLKPHPKNPRRLSEHDYQHLKKSIDKFGLIDKPIVNKDNLIIGGHQRIEVLKKNGVKLVECWVAQSLLEDKDIDELCIRLNKNTGEFDFDLLANNFEALDLVEWGFEPEELLGKAEELESEEPVAKNKKLKMCPACGHEF